MFEYLSAGHARLRIDESVAGARLTLHLEGELDLASSSFLDANMRALTLDASEIVLDLSDLRFMDSSGLHLILQLQDLCHERDCRLLIASPSRQVQRLFEVSGLVDPMRRTGLLAEG